MLLRRLIVLWVATLPGCFNSSEKIYNEQVTKMVEDAGGYTYLAEKAEARPDDIPPYAVISIFLPHVDLSTFDLGALSPLEHLQDIGLEATEFHDHQISFLLNCPSLRLIDLKWTEVTDNGVKQLTGLPNLEALNLIGCNVTDQCVDDLLAMKSLKEVKLWDTHVTGEGAKRLRDHGLSLFWERPVSNEEVRRVIVALNRRDMLVLSLFKPQSEDGPSFRFRISVLDESRIDPGVASDLQTLEQFAPLAIATPPTEMLLQLKDLTRIDDLSISSYAHEKRDPAKVIEYLSQCQPQSLRFLSLSLAERLPPELLARWIQTPGLERLYLEQQEINSPVWQAIVAAPALKKIQFHDCQFQQIEQFSPTERPIMVEIFDEETGWDEESSYSATVRRLLNAGKEPPQEETSDQDPPSEL
ncbi:hypothetical protein DTL42_21850 [Bremerella cremea]|uniref:Leucine Rich repeats (2 copies) n=1 Tax=Bremerella cremea TaxID=1031537 RepID=A0A368KKC2_9BACT|nr:hypothetical protein [Bremerella cremea]RCS41217.1 hypothetical protein DTL42_21850 [Bremerella cremea]